jgi:L-amino acid N-acyltransferase YncA
VAAWCAQRIPHFVGWANDPQAIGWERAGELRAGVVYTEYSGANIVTAIALDEPMTRKFLITVLWYPFVQLKTHRITALVERANMKSLRLCEHLGFKLEGILREAAIDGGDILLLGMLRSECKWL